jgi:hypothetical protein
MDHHHDAAGFGYGMDFSTIDFGTAEFTKPSEGNTETNFFGDEGIDTTYGQFDQSFNSMNTQLFPVPVTESSFPMQQSLVRSLPYSSTAHQT